MPTTWDSCDQASRDGEAEGLSIEETFSLLGFREDTSRVEFLHKVGARQVEQRAARPPLPVTGNSSPLGK